tara:strand:- start:5247 stop:5444 length:198 start_codon:yes stop_codon:yes gene_type:complete
MNKYFIGEINCIRVAFQSAKDADANSDEWVEMEAESLEKAFEGYEKAFDAWQAKWKAEFAPDEEW